ncbi:MAG: D-alanine--D-alanine ligase [Campylobacterales bacterium]
MTYAIFFGGSSYEHEISIVSAIVLKDIIIDRCEFVFIDQERELYLIDAKDMKSTYFSSFAYKKAPKLRFKKGGLESEKKLFSKTVEFDVAINLIHGRDGEDGKLASLFEFYDIDALTPSLEASAISYNKLLTKQYANIRGVKTLPFEIVKRGESIKSIEYPLILKPLRLGSSIGVSIIKSKDELEYGLDVAFEFDSDVLIEPFVEGIKEYNLSGFNSKGEFVFSKVEEVKKEAYLDFDKKYCDFSRSSVVDESGVDEGLKSSLREAFEALYADMFEGAMIRCDFFVQDKEVFINEINPIPGSLANYLYEDFNTALKKASNSLKECRDIKIDYLYINKIKNAKGK